MTTQVGHWIVVRPTFLPFVSFRIDLRVPLVLVTLLALSLVAMSISIGVGQYYIGPLDVLRTLVGAGPPDQAFIINTLRLPRTLVAFLVGVALAVSGTIIQGFSRNPLASPDLVGVNAGASVAAAFVLILLPALAPGIDVPLLALPLAALLGGLLFAVATYMLAWRNGLSPVRLLLIGIATAAVGQALVTAIITRTPGDIWQVTKALVWLSGSVYGRDWTQFWPLLIWTAVLLPVAVLLARQLNALSLGDEVARGVGVRVETQRAIAILASVALASAAVAAAGPVNFIGLMAPHAGRRLVGPSHEGLILTAALLGGLIVVVADLVGRTIAAPLEIPCGLVTGAIGAPYLIFLLIRSRRF